MANPFISIVVEILAPYNSEKHYKNILTSNVFCPIIMKKTNNCRGKMTIKRFLNNLKYLTRYNIKDINNRLNFFAEECENAYYALDNLKYEMEEDLKNIQKPKFYTLHETIEKLADTNHSICRFGDGEIDIIRGKDIAFQKHSHDLAERLKEVLSSNDPNIMIACPNLFNSFGNSDFWARKITRVYYSKIRSLVMNFINCNLEYYHAGISIPYINSGGNTDYNFDEHYNKLKKIWANKDIAIICGDRVFNNIKYNIFENARSVEYLCAPTINAYEQYSDILNKAKKISKDKIFIIILGPTATVLAYDLAKAGYRALDLGHFAKDYDAYRKKIPSNKENICEFFSPD